MNRAKTSDFKSSCVPHPHGLVPNMFSDESNKLETHVCKNEINNSLKNTNLLEDLFILKYLLLSLFGRSTKKLYI